ncbi:MAG: hypothetical protein VKO19_01415 [Cyanobacteriota bacterium]|nr:hypothetical protein [Cyanobacteriota bacterium]
MSTPRRALVILLSIGACGGVLASAICVPPSLAQHQHPVSPSMAQGGDGGDRDAQLVLAQMQGHLLVAKELLQLQNAKAAEPHVGHPVNELYGALAPALQRKGVSPFLPTLEALEQQVRLNPGTPEASLKLARAQQAIAEAAKRMNGGLSLSGPSLFSVVRELGKEAAEEYAAAIAGDQVVEVIEYQDARGFLLEAQRLLEGAITRIPADAAALTARQRTVAAMLKAFPTVLPPRTAVLSVAQLQQLQQLL